MDDCNRSLVILNLQLQPPRQESTRVNLLEGAPPASPGGRRAAKLGKRAGVAAYLTAGLHEPSDAWCQVRAPKSSYLHISLHTNFELYQAGPLQPIPLGLASNNPCNTRHHFASTSDDSSLRIVCMNRTTLGSIAGSFG